MDDNSSKRLTYSGIILIIIGLLLTPGINSVDTLIAALHKTAGLSINGMLISSIVFHGLIDSFLVIGIVLILKSKEIKLPHITFKNFKNIGLVLLSITVLGGLTNHYVKTHYKNELNYDQPIETYDLIRDIAYLTMTQTGLQVLRTILLFVLLFLIIVRKK